MRRRNQAVCAVSECACKYVSAADTDTFHSPVYAFPAAFLTILSSSTPISVKPQGHTMYLQLM